MNHDLNISNLEKTKNGLTGVIAQHYIQTIGEALQGYRVLLANERCAKPNTEEGKDKVISTLNQRCAGYEREIAKLRKWMEAAANPKQDNKTDEPRFKAVACFDGYWRVLDRKTDKTLNYITLIKKKAEELAEELNATTDWDTDVYVEDCRNPEHHGPSPMQILDAILWR